MQKLRTVQRGYEKIKETSGECGDDWLILCIIRAVHGSPELFLDTLNSGHAPLILVTHHWKNKTPWTDNLRWMTFVMTLTGIAVPGGLTQSSRKWASPTRRWKGPKGTGSRKGLVQSWCSFTRNGRNVAKNINADKSWTIMRNHDKPRYTVW